MTYQARNKPKSDSFSRIISFCNNLLPNYQNLCPKCTQWLRRDAGASVRGVLEGSMDPQGFTILVFSRKLCFRNSVTAAKTIRYADLNPQGSPRPQQFAEMTPLTRRHGWPWH